MKSIDTQLVIGPYEAAHFTIDELMGKLDAYVQAVPPQRLIIWNNQGDTWFERIVRYCENNKLEPYLWYPVLADRMESPFPREWEQVRSACGQVGYGNHGVWNGFDDNDENFLFHCPEHSISRPAIREEIETTLGRFGFCGVFLDRIRYPSPANGLEMLFSCFCDRCIEAGYVNQRMQANKALRYMADACLEGQAMNWSSFVARTGLQNLMERKAWAIESVVSYISESLETKRYSIGLDLLTPSIAQLVGQDYSRLARHCDWIKAMTYTKAIGPAGLPLELDSLMQGLRAFDERITLKQAGAWFETLLGLAEGSVQTYLESGVFDGQVLQSEIGRAVDAVQGMVPVFAGIEMVDHPVFPTKIVSSQLLPMIETVNSMHVGMVSCWNLLYIPEQNYSLLKE